MVNAAVLARMEGRVPGSRVSIEGLTGLRVILDIVNDAERLDQLTKAVSAELIELRKYVDAVGPIDEITNLHDEAKKDRQAARDELVKAQTVAVATRADALTVVDSDRKKLAERVKLVDARTLQLDKDEEAFAREKEMWLAQVREKERILIEQEKNNKAARDMNTQDRVEINKQKAVIDSFRAKL